MADYDADGNPIPTWQDVREGTVAPDSGTIEADSQGNPAVTVTVNAPGAPTSNNLFGLLLLVGALYLLMGGKVE